MPARPSGPIPRISRQQSGALLLALSLLALSRVLVPAGPVTTTLGLELGSLSLLHMAGSLQGDPSEGSGKTTPPREPGRWIHKTSTTKSNAALNYQEQITGQPAWRVYMLGEVEFDGFTGKALLEAKGPNYKNFFTRDGQPQPWYVLSGGFSELMTQAEKQSRLAERLKLPLIWHVADAEVVKILRTLFDNEGWTNIDVRHTRPAR